MATESRTAEYWVYGPDGAFLRAHLTMQDALDHKRRVRGSMQTKMVTKAESRAAKS